MKTVNVTSVSYVTCLVDPYHPQIGRVSQHGSRPEAAGRQQPVLE